MINKDGELALDKTFDFSIMLDGTDCLDIDEKEAIGKCQEARIIKNNWVIIPKGARLIESNYFGAMECVFEWEGHKIIADLAIDGNEIIEYFGKELNN